MNARGADASLVVIAKEDERTTRHPPRRHASAAKRWRLCVTEGSARGRVFGLPPGEHLVGRDASADIRLLDSGVSRRHAKIVFSSDGLVVIADLDSTNGVWVNDARVELAALREGYRIRIGTHAELELQAVAEADAPAWSLTPRQLEIAQLAAQGHTNAEIAEALGIKRRTVATHLEQIYRRLQLRSRAELGRILAAAPTPSQRPTLQRSPPVDTVDEP